MPYPDAYERDFGFAGYQESHPTTPLPGNQVDAELDSAAARSAEIVAFLKRFTRADGRLANRSVGVDQLSADFSIGFKSPTTWEPEIQYLVGDTVFYGAGFYLCETAHTSGSVFAPSNWSLIVDFGMQAQSAAASAASAAASAAEIAGSLSTTAALLSHFGADAVVANGTGYQTLGRTTAGDGGGAAFYYDSADTTTADNGGTVRVDGQGRRFKVAEPKKVRVRQFGAGNGSYSGDTAAFQAALAAAKTAGTDVETDNGDFYIDDTLDLCEYGSTDCASLIGAGPKHTRIHSQLTGTTALISMKGDEETHFAAGVRGMSLLPSNAGPIGSRNCGTAILLEGVQFPTLEDVDFGTFTDGIHLHNELSGQFTEELVTRNVKFDQCDAAIRFTRTSGNDSFRGWKGHVAHMGVSGGQTGIYMGPNTFLYNCDVTVEGTGYGASPKMLDIYGNGGGGVMRLLFEDQTSGATGLYCNLDAGMQWAIRTFLNVQGGLGLVLGTMGLRVGDNLGGGQGLTGFGLVASRRYVLAANAIATLPKIAGGHLWIRDSSVGGGGTADVRVDAARPSKIGIDEDELLSITDPAPGGDKLYVYWDTAIPRILNRFDDEKVLDVTIVGAG